MRAEDTGSKSAISSPVVNAAAATLLCVILSAYLIYRHWHTISIYAVFLIFVPLCIHLFGLFQRARALVDSMESDSVRSKSAVFDLSFWAAISNLTLLIYISVLLRHIDGFF